MSKFCVNCGNELKEGTMFCPKCGTRVVNDNNVNDTNTNDNKTSTGYQYTRPEKVRFSERWLLVKLAILMWFDMAFISDTIDALANQDFMGVIAGVALICLFGYFIRRNVREYSGNPYMLKFNMTDDTVMTLDRMLNSKYLHGALGLLACIIYVWKLIVMIDIFGLFHLYTWLAPISHISWIILLSALIEFIDMIILSTKPYEWCKSNAAYYAEDEDDAESTEDDNTTLPEETTIEQNEDEGDKDNNNNA